MKKALLRVFSLAFALLMLTSLTACATPGESETTTASQENTSAALPETTAPLYEDDDLPDDLRIGGVMGVLAWDDVEHEEFIDLDDDTGDMILEKLYQRIKTVESRLGTVVEFTRIKGNSDNVATWNTYVEKAMQGGDHSFDVVAGYSLSVAKNASSGFLYNLLDAECHYLNFNKPWWSDLLVKEASMNGKMYFASGDISRNAFEMMYVCFVNSDLLTNYNLENPQDLVLSGDWTYDKFFSMCTGLYKDLDSSGSKTCENGSGDQFGYITSGIHVDPWFYGSGAQICEKDADGNLIASPSFGGERVINTVDKLNAFLASEDGIYTSSVTHQRAFGEGRSLFMMDRARVSHKVLKKEYEINYLVLPCPKYDKDQANYVTVMGNPFTLYAIRRDAVNVENAAAFIECMASEGYRTVTPVVFDSQLKTRYVDDPISSKMYDLIRANLTFDLGRLFSNTLIGQSDFRNAIKNGSKNWSTIATGKMKILNKTLPTVTENFK